MKIIRVEETPNPNARKFVLDGSITEQPLSFFNAGAAKGYKLAEQLFGIAGVSSLLFLGDFVTVNKSPKTKWADITSSVRQVLQKK